MAARRLRTYLCALGLTVLVIASAATASRAADNSAGTSAVPACAKVLLGVTGPSAAARPGSADPAVAAELAVLRVTRTAADALPPSKIVGPAMATAGATSYDPAAAVLLSGSASQGGEYVVPATLSQARFTNACGSSGGAAAYLAFEDEGTGTGPGVCLVTTQRETDSPAGSGLPGAPVPKPTTKLTSTQTHCVSLAVLDGYGGPLGDQSSGSPTALIPDGVSQVTYTLADGHAFTVPVAGNLASPPTQLAIDPTASHPSTAQLSQLFASHLPVAITETAADGSVVAQLTRPTSLVSEGVGSDRFLEAALSGLGFDESSTTGTGAFCRAATHSCVAAELSLTCTSRTACHLTRVIHRYRYVGKRPPAGTTGIDTQDTAPIVGRATRVIHHPGKVSVRLRGSPQSKVTLLLALNCSTGTTEEGSSEPSRVVAVPSQTPISLPGPASRLQACSIGVLATSPHKGSVHVTIVRG